jgi:hypothetical protein
MKKIIASTLVALAVFGAAGAAEAASKKCSIGLTLATGDCTTGWVRANAKTHHVHISVSRFLNYSVKDIDTHVQIARGKSNLSGVEKTIGGLYGRYTASINNIATAVLGGGSVTIHNN